MTQDSLPVGRKAESSGNPAAYPADAPTPAPDPPHPRHDHLAAGRHRLRPHRRQPAPPHRPRRTGHPAARRRPGLVRDAPRHPHFPAPDHIDGKGALPWAAVAVVFGIWELYAAVRGSTPAHPTLSILMGPLIDPPFARAAGYALWLAVGVWVVRR
ncbi:hypothetical protein ACFQ9X_25660 [Catenulispora yoronensis]